MPANAPMSIIALSAMLIWRSSGNFRTASNRQSILNQTKRFLYKEIRSRLRPFENPGPVLKGGIGYVGANR